MEMRQSIKMQWGAIWSQKKIHIVFWGLLLLVSINYVTNVFLYQGRDVKNMYFPMYLLTISCLSGKYQYYLNLFYPILVVLPAGFAYLIDRDSGQTTYIQARTGKKAYYFGKIAAVFLSTFVVFAVPFLLEALLSCIAFPLSADGSPTNFSPSTEAFIIYSDNYLCSRFFIRFPYLYSFCFILGYGMIAGILAVFTSACSMIGKGFPFRVFVFLPVYILLYLTQLLEGVVSARYGIYTNYAIYINLFDLGPKSFAGMMGFLLLLLVVSAMIVSIKSRGDNLK